MVGLLNMVDVLNVVGVLNVVDVLNVVGVLRTLVVGCSALLINAIENAMHFPPGIQQCIVFDCCCCLFWLIRTSAH